MMKLMFGRCKTPRAARPSVRMAKVLPRVLAPVMDAMTSAAHSASAVDCAAQVKAMRAVLVVGAAAQIAAATKAIRHVQITATPHAQPPQVRAVVAAVMGAEIREGTLLTATVSTMIVCQAE